MKFVDEGIVLSLKKYSENSIILKVFTQNRGVCAGLVKESSFSKKNKYAFQIGDLIQVSWVARNESDLGTFQAEPIKSYSNLVFDSSFKSYLLQFIVNLLLGIFHEKQNEENFYNSFIEFLKLLNQENDIKIILVKYVKLELLLLEVLGIGLDFSECAISKDKNNLCYISPKTGQAVSKGVGFLYKNKLFDLPEFLIDCDVDCDKEDILQGLKITGYFLKKYLQENNEKVIKSLSFYRNKFLMF